MYSLVFSVLFAKILRKLREIFTTVIKLRDNYLSDESVLLISLFPSQKPFVYSLILDLEDIC